MKNFSSRFIVIGNDFVRRDESVLQKTEEARFLNKILIVDHYN